MGESTSPSDMSSKPSVDLPPKVCKVQPKQEHGWNFVCNMAVKWGKLNPFSKTVTLLDDDVDDLTTLPEKNM